MGDLLARLDFYDWLTLAVLVVLIVAGVFVITFILALPGKIALARKHPHADAVNLMGWVGFLAVVPWIQALIWAFKDTEVVDIRRFPKAEQRAIDEHIARLSGATPQTSPDNAENQQAAAGKDNKKPGA